jgi:DNA-binding response OmpR family regulator
MSKHILLVDDDTLMRRSLAFNLEQTGYRVSAAANAEDALGLVQREPPDLILLDIGLPGMDGLDALLHFKQQTDRPIIFVTARCRDLDHVLGLELGADDYITKPVDLNILLAHVKAVLRRYERAAAASPAPTVLDLDGLVIDPAAHTVRLAGQPLELSPREFALLYTLTLSAGRVVSVDDLLTHVWGVEYEGESQVVYVHIHWLREKLESDPHHPWRIVTMRGVGYKLEPTLSTTELA